MRVRRSRAVKSLLLLLVDFAIVTIIPLIVINFGFSSFEAIEKLLLIGFLFYLTTCICSLLFPSTCERYLFPVASLYLVLGTLQSLLTFLDDSGFELQLAIFVYKLMDSITVATLVELFVAELAPTYKHIGPRLNAFVNNKLLNSVKRDVHVTGGNNPAPFPSRVKENKSPSSPDGILKTVLIFLREGKYKLCVESCDAGVEKMIVATLLQLYPARLEAPMAIEEQLAKLESKGVPIQVKRIIQLRRLRNSLTASCREATIDQARFAVRVLHMALKTIRNFGITISSSADRK
jgi:hypothetical protein